MTARSSAWRRCACAGMGGHGVKGVIKFAWMLNSTPANENVCWSWANLNSIDICGNYIEHARKHAHSTVSSVVLEGGESVERVGSGEKWTIRVLKNPKNYYPDHNANLSQDYTMQKCNDRVCLILWANHESSLKSKARTYSTVNTIRTRPFQECATTKTATRKLSSVLGASKKDPMKPTLPSPIRSSGRRWSNLWVIPSFTLRFIPHTARFDQRRTTFLRENAELPGRDFPVNLQAIPEAEQTLIIHGKPERNSA